MYAISLLFTKKLVAKFKQKHRERKTQINLPKFLSIAQPGLKVMKKLI